jgi:hypothetical protein
MRLFIRTNIAGITLRQTHSRQHPSICHDNHHPRRCPRRPRHRRSPRHPCLPHDPNPKSLTAASTQERNVAIRHASRKNRSFRQPKNSGRIHHDPPRLIALEQLRQQPRIGSGNENICPAPSFTTKAAPISSTVQGKGVAACYSITSSARMSRDVRTSSEPLFFRISRIAIKLASTLN